MRIIKVPFTEKTFAYTFESKEEALSFSKWVDSLPSGKVVHAGYNLLDINDKSMQSMILLKWGK